MRISAAEIAVGQEKQSERIYSLLQQHVATRDEMEREFDAADEECRLLAGQVGAARMAHSPQAVALKAELTAKRYSRDYVRDKWIGTMQDYERQLEALSRDEIQGFLDWAVKTLKELPHRRRINEERKLYDHAGNLHGIRVNTNLEAERRAKDRIMAAMQEIRQVRAMPLKEIRERIEAVRNDIATIDFDEYTAIDATDADLADMKIHPEVPKMVSGHLGAGGHVTLTGVPISEFVNSEISQLKNRGRI